jgi:hypothetical protein
MMDPVKACKDEDLKGDHNLLETAEAKGLR